MSAPLILRFPAKNTMIRFLSNHKLLNTEYNNEKGITIAIAKVAASRLSDRDLFETSVKLNSDYIINDLQTGRCGFTGKALPNLRKLQLDSLVWSQTSRLLEEALIDCAKSEKT